MREFEDVEDFVDRLKPVHGELVEEQAEGLLKLIGKSWPLSNCDSLLGAFELGVKESGVEVLINYREAAPQINLWLKSWFQNSELAAFLSRVEERVGSMLMGKGPRVVETGQALLSGAQGWVRDLKGLCSSSSLYTIDLEELLGEREDVEIDPVLCREAEELFDRKPVSGFGSGSKGTPPSKEDKDTWRGGESLPAKFPLNSKNPCPILSEYMEDLQRSWTECHRLRNAEVMIPSLMSLEKDLKEKRTWALERWEIIKGRSSPPLGQPCRMRSTPCSDKTYLKLKLTKCRTIR
jgi:hypothetical protein